MKRDIRFNPNANTSAESFGIPIKRASEIEKTIADLLEDGGKNMAELAQTLNDRGDLSDSEWTFAMLSIGYSVSICALTNTSPQPKRSWPDRAQ